MTEAGLPVIVHRGRDGGIELGFDYRTRLTGLDRAEAEAMALILTQPLDRLEPFGLAAEGARARAKIWEAFPDQTRAAMAETRDRFSTAASDAPVDPRCPALAKAIRDRVIVRLRMRAPPPQEVWPTALTFDGDTWWLTVADKTEPIPMADWGDINISSKRFA